MARERASTGVEIWGETDFRDLTGPAQALWFKLHTHPHLNYAGVVDFHPGRLAALTREQTVLDVMVAAQELSTKWWCVFDQDTDEVLVRGWLRHDGLLKQPRLAVSLAKAYAAIGSNKIRAVVVNEVLRYRKENPDLTAWDGVQMRSLLKQTAVSVQDVETELRLPSGVVYDQGDALTDGQAHGQVQAQRSPEPQTSRTPTPTPAPTPATRPNGLSTPDGTESSTPSTAQSRVARLRVDFGKVQRRFTEQAGEPVDDDLVLRLVTTVIGRARHQDGDRTGLVLRSLKQDWASDWAKLAFTDSARDDLVASGIEPPPLAGLDS